jgi:methenyltetrahydromethanopterin cyclohydrolase
VTPDLTYVRVTNNSNVSLNVPQASFTTHTGVQIVIPDAAVAALGTPAAGWKVRVQANSRFSNEFII